MKPDEHKQKKNALYKKKHGITGKVVAAATTPGSHASNKKGDTVTDCVKQAGAIKETSGNSTSYIKELAAASQAFVEGNSRQDSGNSLKEQVDTTAEVESMPSQTYRRRKLESNWERYEESKQEEPVLRGADLRELLKSSASVRTQFQFRSTEDLLTVNDGPDVPPSLTEFTDLLTVDCIHLAASLSCVPLHDRLNLEPSLFTAEQISSFVLDAERHVAEYTLTAQSASVTESVTDKNMSRNCPVNEGEAKKDTVTTTVDPMRDFELDELLGSGTSRVVNIKRPVNSAAADSSVQSLSHINRAAVNNNSICDAIVEDSSIIETVKDTTQDLKHQDTNVHHSVIQAIQSTTISQLDHVRTDNIGLISDKNDDRSVELKDKLIDSGPTITSLSLSELEEDLDSLLSM